MSETFTYESNGKQRQSVISLALASRIADAFQAARVHSPFSQEIGSRVDGRYVDGERSWKLYPEIVTLVQDAPEFWELDVSHIQGLRQSAAARESREETTSRLLGEGAL